MNFNRDFWDALPISRLYDTCTSIPYVIKFVINVSNYPPSEDHNFAIILVVYVSNTSD